MAVGLLPYISCRHWPLGVVGRCWECASNINIASHVWGWIDVDGFYCSHALLQAALPECHVHERAIKDSWRPRAQPLVN